MSYQPCEVYTVTRQIGADGHGFTEVLTLSHILYGQVNFQDVGMTLSVEAADPAKVGDIVRIDNEDYRLGNPKRNIPQGFDKTYTLTKIDKPITPR